MASKAKQPAQLPEKPPTAVCRRMQFDTAGKALQAKNLYWLHFPKTGTSFISTVWNYACGQGEAQLDLTVSDTYSALCRHCYDFALMERYPRAEYCMPGVLHENFTTLHVPISRDQVEKEALKAAAMFRKPSQRLISAHHDCFHASGFSAQDTDALHARCDIHPTGQSICSRNTSVDCFARFPGIAGCMTRMLSGRSCAESSSERDGSEFDGGLSLVQDARSAIQQLAFVGLTERWDESVCLFHRMFGGSINPAEFVNFHHYHDHDGKQLYPEDSLEGFQDVADEMVYGFAKERFAALLREHVPHGASACDGLIELGQSSCSCGAELLQCGSAPKVGLDCGYCPKARLSFEAQHRQEMDWNNMTVACDQGACRTSDPSIETSLFRWTPAVLG